MTKHCHTFLALGDSYTIGEGLPIFESFPYQTVQLLRAKGFHFHAPEIAAKSGWTTFELAEHILHTHLNNPYDFVTLLIGVNNQYRNHLATDYENDFEFLLKKAIHYSGENPSRVIVLSIPDWSKSPFAKGRDIKLISSQIEHFNTLNYRLASKYKVGYIDVSKTGLGEAGLENYIHDKLHPAKVVYELWATLVAEAMEKAM